MNVNGLYNMLEHPARTGEAPRFAGKRSAAIQYLAVPYISSMLQNSCGVPHNPVPIKEREWSPHDADL